MKNEEKCESASSVAVEPVFVKKHQSFFEEQPLPVIEMAPRVLRYRTRREVLVFGIGAAAAMAVLDFSCHKLRSVAWACIEI
jgi:hypothetical protein